MNLKYYMRGVGTGIIFTTMIFLAFDKPKALTDAEIKLRAAALGMVEENSLMSEADAIAKEEGPEENNEQTDAVDNNVDSSQDTVAEAEEQSVKEEEEKNLSPSTEASDSESHLITKEESVVENYEDPQFSEEKNDSTGEEIAQQDKEYVSFIVETGDVARTVSTKLYEAGLIESVEEYSNFLSGNSYSYRIRAGEYQIPVGADYQEIANILCKLP
ncbi:MAG: hypothetical protein IKW28_09520 [Lachnospiraceae bacterium]|nr:hypothetical protein [Lachnospiraceae bacterium]